MTIVRQTGRTLFGDNCAACHGFNAKGGKGFPDLTTASWLWGGDPETIAETIRRRINSTHPNTRMGQMLAFGRDRMFGLPTWTTWSATSSRYPIRRRQVDSTRDTRCGQGNLCRLPVPPVTAMTARGSATLVRRT